MSGMLSIDPPHAFRVPSSLRARPAQSADLACCPCATVRSQQEYFSKFGELTDVVVMMSGQGPDRHPRGFGFVTFANPAALDLVGCQRYHSIGNRKVEVKRALSREVMQGVKASAVPESVERHMAANAGWQPHAPLNAPANTAIYGTMQQGVYDNNHAYINNSGWVHQVQPTCGAPRCASPADARTHTPLPQHVQAQQSRLCLASICELNMSVLHVLRASQASGSGDDACGPSHECSGDNAGWSAH